MRRLSIIQHHDHGTEPRDRAAASCLACNLCTSTAAARQRPLAAGCLVHANPSSPEAGLLGHVGMKAATGWHAAQGPGSNPILGACISIRMNMSISSGWCWEAEYENRC